MKIITIANQKGGIGKTTTAIAMASILNKKGKRTLLIDTDAQCNSTDVYGASTEGVATIYDVILAPEKERVAIKDAIQHTEYGDIIASDRLLVDAEATLMSDRTGGTYRLVDAIEKEKLDYDYIIIDTNPAVNSLLYNALIASDEVIIPVTADRFGMAGLSQLVDTINEVKRRPNPKLKVAGLLLIKYKEHTTFGQTLREDLQNASKQMGTVLFNTAIRESVKVQEAQAVGKSIVDYAPKNNSTVDYVNFVNEYIKRG